MEKFYDNPKIHAYLQQIETGKYESDMVRVAIYIKDNPGCTLDDILIHLKYSESQKRYYSTLSARVTDLESIGLIYREGVNHNENNAMSYTRWFYEPDRKKQIENAKNILRDCSMLAQPNLK